MIGIIDYGVGNLGSISNSLAYLNIPFVVSRDPKELETCQRLILPGVGAFGTAVSSLETSGLRSYLLQTANERKPILGICLGMQLLLTGSDESPGAVGLDLIPGQVHPFQKMKRKIHMGWNSVEFKRSGLVKDGYAYFVHGYYCQPDDNDTIFATSEYGINFPCIIKHDQVFGMQFHPEKSQDLGLALLKAYNDGKI